MKIVQLTSDNREPFRQYDNPVPWFGTAPEALLQGFAAIPEAEVHVITCCQRPMVSSPEKLAENIWFHSLHVPKLGWLRTAYQGCIRAMRRKIQEIAPDIVHGQGTERDCSMGAIFSGFPRVLTIHGNMRLVAKIKGAPPLSFYWLAARLESFVLPRAQGVVCLSRHTERAVHDLAHRTWVLPNAVDSSFFNLHPRPENPDLILCIGSISPWKNQNAFIRALDPLATNRSFRVIFLGQLLDDAYGAEFRSLISTRPWCEYRGFLDRNELKIWLSRATILALPSLEDNCPMVVLEAMAAGIPVVAANIGGVPDLVADGKTGLLCDPSDGESMMGAVTKLLENPDLATSLAASGRTFASENFHPLRIAQRHLEIYHEILNRRNPVR